MLWLLVYGYALQYSNHVLSRVASCCHVSGSGVQYLQCCFMLLVLLVMFGCASTDHFGWVVIFSFVAYNYGLCGVPRCCDAHVVCLFLWCVILVVCFVVWFVWCATTVRCAYK